MATEETQINDGKIRELGEKSFKDTKFIFSNILQGPLGGFTFSESYVTVDADPGSMEMSFVVSSPAKLQLVAEGFMESFNISVQAFARVLLDDVQVGGELTSMFPTQFHFESVESVQPGTHTFKMEYKTEAMGIGMSITGGLISIINLSLL